MLDIKHGKNAINLTNIVVLVKTKNQNYWAQKMTICNLSFYIYIQDRYGAIVSSSVSKQVSSPCCSFLQNMLPIS